MRKVKEVSEVLRKVLGEVAEIETGVRCLWVMDDTGSVEVDKDIIKMSWSIRTSEEDADKVQGAIAPRLSNATFNIFDMSFETRDGTPCPEYRLIATIKV